MKYVVVYKNKGIKSVFNRFRKEEYECARDAYEGIIKSEGVCANIYYDDKEMLFTELAEQVMCEMSSRVDNMRDTIKNCTKLTDFDFTKPNHDVEMKFLDSKDKEVFKITIDEKTNKVKMDFKDYDKLFYLINSSEYFKISLCIFEEMRTMFKEFGDDIDMIKSIVEEIFYYSLECGELKLAE